MCLLLGGAGGLAAMDPALNAAAAGASSGNGMVTSSVIAAAISAVVAILCSVLVVLVVRYARRRCSSQKPILRGGSDTDSDLSSIDSSRFHFSPSSIPSKNRSGSIDNFGFSTVSSKFSARPVLDIEGPSNNGTTAAAPVASVSDPDTVDVMNY